LSNKRPLVMIIGILFVHGGVIPKLIVAYPVFPWLAMMMLGFAFGKKLMSIRNSQSPRWSPEKILLIGGTVSLLVFGIIRGLNSYGNMLLLRENNSLIQWLHVSKYPPSLSFTALELGLMGIILSLLFRLQARARKPIRLWNPILVFGQTALFFYILHIPLLELSARLLNMHMALGLGTTYIATLAALILLYPCCLWYRQYKTAHPSGWPRYL
jgi:uncharacterized membrane protein